MSFLTVFSQTTLLDNSRFFVFALYDSSAPTIVLQKIAPAKPYGNPLQVTFNLVNMQQGHIYRLRLWESVNDLASGQVRNSANVNGSTSSISLRESIYAEVDVTPNWVSGQPTVADATYVGWTISKLTRNPDYLVPSDAPDNDIADWDRNTDGFTLLNGIDLNPNEQWCVEFAPQIITSSSGSSDFETGRIITGDTVLTNADKNQMLIIRSSSSTIKITVADSTTITDFTDRFYIKSEGGNHINVELVLISGADSFAYLGTSITKFYLGQSEDLFIFAFNKQYFAMSNPQGMKMVGSYLYSDKLTVQNYILCAGNTLVRAEYPMLWAYVQALGTAVSLVTWNTNSAPDGITYYPNRRFFHLGDGTTTFGLPDMQSFVIKGATSAHSGESENFQSVQHEHEAPIGHLSPPPFGSGPTTRTIGRYNGTISEVSDLVGPMVTTGGTGLTLVGNEVKIRTGLKYCLIRIG